MSPSSDQAMNPGTGTVPVGLWLAGHKDETFITLTYGDLAFWCAIIGAQVLLVVRLVHRAPPP
jgi:hypothetical protein